MFIDMPSNLQAAFVHVCELVKTNPGHRDFLAASARAAVTRLHVAASWLKDQHEAKPDIRVPLRQLAKATSEWQTFGEEMFLEVSRIGLTLLAYVQTSTNAIEISALINDGAIKGAFACGPRFHPLISFWFH